MDMKYSKKLVRENRVKKLSQTETKTIWEVNDHLVTFQVKKGRNILTCDCFNGTLFCNEGFCEHQKACIGFEWDNKFNERIDKLIGDYKIYKKLKLPVSADLMIYDLESIKNLK
jgi:hypothetical protein